MPVNIKILLTVLVAMVGVGVFFFEELRSERIVGFVAALLSLVMILSIWIFPEAKETGYKN